MTGDDEVRAAARRALYRIGFAHAILLRPWADIRARARRLQGRRVAVGVVIVAALLTGAGAANTLVARGTPSSDARNDGPATSATTTGASSTTSPTSETAPASASAPAGSELPPPPDVTDTTDAPTSTTEPVLAPYDEGVSWSSVTTTDTPQVVVGGAIVLHASLTNTGTHAFVTLGYGSIGVACDQLAEPHTERDARVGTFLDFVVIQPGETHTFTATLTAPDYVGRLTCGVGFAYHGDAFVAGPTYGPADAIVDVAPAPVTTTAPPVATTSIPLSTSGASADA